MAPIVKSEVSSATSLGSLTARWSRQYNWRF